MSEVGQGYTQGARAAAQRKDDKASVFFMQQAIKAFERASLAEPPEVDYRVFLANAYGSIGQYDKAMEILEKVLEQRPYSLPGHLLYGQFLRAVGRKSEAVKQYEAAVLVAPDSPDALAYLVTLERELGHEAQAAQYQERLDKLTGGGQ